MAMFLNYCGSLKLFSVFERKKKVPITENTLEESFNNVIKRESLALVKEDIKPTDIELSELVQEATESINSVVIENLTEEILINIFEYLDPESVKEAALVCSNWNHLIGNAPAVMRKFKLKLEIDEELPENFDEMLSLRRRHVSMEFQHNACFCHQLHHKQLVEMLMRKFGPTIRHTKIEGKMHLDKRTFSKLLAYTSKLVTLELDHVVFLPVDKGMPSAVTLEKLKTIVSFESDWNIFDLIKASGLKALQLRNHENEYPYSLLENFLKATPSLEIADFSFDFFNDMTPNFSFKLKTIKGGKITRFTENCQQFLLSQSATVESIQIFTDLSDFNKFILQYFKNLAFMDLNWKSLNAESKEFFDELLPFPRMREIKVDDFPTQEIAESFLSKCPGLVKIASTFFLLPFMLDKMANLTRKLEILDLNTIADSSLRFAFLKSLSLSYIANHKCFSMFLENNSTIETLEIGRVEGRKLSNELFSKLLNVKNLKLQGCRSAMEKVHNRIKSGYGRLENLLLKVKENGCNYVFVYKFSRNTENWKRHGQLFDDVFLNVNSDL